MSRPGTGARAALLPILLLGLHQTRAEAAAAVPPPPLLGYCAPPVVPACIDELKGHPETLAHCAPRAEAYESSVFAYRVCLTREMERAVREANTALEKLRCAQGRRAC